MPHIILHGHTPSVAGLSSLLQQWGMTWSVREAGPLPTLPTIHECDACILDLPALNLALENEVQETEAAPLVLLGDQPGSVLLTRVAWRAVLNIGPEGADLKSALLATIDEAVRLRGKDPVCPHKDGYLSFLGHELRSPLTAAKTALEVLQGELGGGTLPSPESPTEARTTAASPELQMLDIALRNIKRLHQTVDWSQDLQELEAGLAPACWERVSCVQVADALGSESLFSLAGETGDLAVDTDLELLKVLYGQARRVLDYAYPDQAVRGLLTADPDRPQGLAIELQVDARAAQEGPRINRTHLTRTGSESDCSPGEELELLTRYVVSRRLAEKLQVRVEVFAASKEVPRLRLLLVASAAQDAADRNSPEPSALRTLA